MPAASRAVVSVSALGALWSASRGVYGVLLGLNAIYGVRENRGYWYTRSISVLYTFALLMVLLLTLVLNLFGIESDYRYLGQDAFDENYAGCAVFQDHAWVTASGAYQDGRVIAAFTDEGPTAAEIEAMNALAQRYVHMNNLLLESDYYGRRRAE